MARQKQSARGETLHYEVRCPGCNVSYPVGTKSCLHCGQRTALPGEGPMPTLRGDGYDPNAFPDFESEAQGSELLEETEGRTRSPFRLGMSGIWILLALVGSAYRVCSGG